MKNLIVIIMVVTIMIGTTSLSYSGDEEWATAGKVLAIIEGARVITGGNLDLIGNVTGISSNGGWFSSGNSSSSRYKSNKRYARNYAYSSKQVWVPRYIWQKKYIPEHEEYSKQYGTILVEGHYIKYKVEDSGHWEY